MFFFLSTHFVKNKNNDPTMTLLTSIACVYKAYYPVPQSSTIIDTYIHCAAKCSLEHKMRIHLQRKIGPNKSTVYYLLSAICGKTVPSCFCFLPKSFSIFLTLFFLILTSLETTEEWWEKLRDGPTHCQFWSFLWDFSRKPVIEHHQPHPLKHKYSCVHKCSLR